LITLAKATKLNSKKNDNIAITHLKPKSYKKRYTNSPREIDVSKICELEFKKLQL